MKERVVTYSSAELPRLEIARTRSINDFEVERFSIIASGWRASEAKQGMEFLLAEVDRRFPARHKKGREEEKNAY